jgi:ketosteroid isomerase-like protein
VAVGAPTATAVRPEEVPVALAKALNFGDLEAAAGCFARDACFMTPDRTMVCGRDEVRPLLAQLIAMRLTARVELIRMHVVGDTALGSERWTMRFDTGNGSPLGRTSESTVLLRQVEGDWKILIAAPWGGVG